jgi:ribonuclease BN (tRNA processing enzyme)
MDQVFAFHEVAVGTLSIGPFQVTLARTAHPVECHAVRLEADGASLVYTADTGASDAVAALAHGADLLLAEASFIDGADNPPDLHLSGREAGELALAAGVGRLVVTHVPPWHDSAVAMAEARAAWGREPELALPGARFQVP